MTRRQKKNLIRIIVSLSMFVAAFIIDKIFNLATIIDSPFGWFLPLIIYLIIYIVIGYDVIKEAVEGIINGQLMDEHFLMAIATLGAFALAIYRGVLYSKGRIPANEIEGFDEACAVILFYQVGEFFQSYAVSKSRKSISSLMDIRPDRAIVLKEEIETEVDPEEVQVDDAIVVYPGEKIPLDGIVIKGESQVDQKALTGESLPIDVAVGSMCISGTLNMSSRLEIKVTKAFYDSTVSKILDLVENATDSKSKAENFITKFARIYTPIVVFSALALAFFPPIFIGIFSGNWNAFNIWVYRALSFLVVSCPCALVISIPLSFFSGIGAASRYGILIKGTNYLERFNQVNTFVFDKTGTLTKGNFKVTEVSNENRRDEILKLAAIAEKGSSHPISRSIMDEYELLDNSNYEITNIPGYGIRANGELGEILCGNSKLMDSYEISYEKCDKSGTIVYVSLNSVFIGWILIKDEIKDETKEVIGGLNELGYKTVMLTGDNDEVAKDIASTIGLTSYKASLLPQDKVSIVEEMLKEKKDNEFLSFVGDGINDAPVLMRSDIGIAMGGVGSDAAIEASDIVLMKDDLKGIVKAKKIAKKTMTIVKENIYLAIGVKVIILILSALGITGMWLAIFGDVGVAIIAILNAMRVNSKYDK